MEARKLEVGAIVGNAVKIGIRNVIPLVANTALWLVTVWIPYLNVGTTIGLFVGVIAKMSKGQAISPTEVFNPEYRKYMGAYFLVSGLKLIGVQFASLLMVIPGIVLSIAWSLAPLLVVDKGEEPTAALHRSNEVTYGNKMGIFLAKAAVMAGAFILFLIIGAIGRQLGFIGALLTLVLVAAVTAAMLAVDSYVYGALIEGNSMIDLGGSPATDQPDAPDQTD